MADRPLLGPSAKGSDTGAQLRALKRRLAYEIDECDEPRDVAALAARYADVVSKLAAMKPAGAATPLDEIGRKRDERRSKPAAG